MVSKWIYKGNNWEIPNMLTDSLVSISNDGKAAIKMNLSLSFSPQIVAGDSSLSVKAKSCKSLIWPLFSTLFSSLYSCLIHLLSLISCRLFPSSTPLYSCLRLPYIFFSLLFMSPVFLWSFSLFTFVFRKGVRHFLWFNIYCTMWTGNSWLK